MVFFVDSCDKVHLSEVEPGVLKETFSDRTYYMLDSCYYATVDENKPYAECNGVIYYQIAYGEKASKHIDPKIAIATKDAYSGAVVIYATDELSVPTYADIDPSGALINVIEVVEYPTGYMNAEQSSQVMEYFRNADTVDRNEIEIDGDTVYWIYFLDKDRPGIYYTLRYVESVDGDRYLYTFDRTRYVALEDNFKEFLDYVKEVKS